MPRDDVYLGGDVSNDSRVDVKTILKPEFKKGDVVHLSKYGLTQFHPRKSLLGIVTNVMADFVTVKRKGQKHSKTYFWEMWEHYE